jgi:hypothetical protein
MQWKSVVFAIMVNSIAVAQVADAPRYQLAQLFGQRCQTARGWCFMAAPAPVGSQCLCPTPFGAVVGVVVQ